MVNKSLQNADKRKMIKCVWEHNDDDTLLYAVDYVGAYTRGETLDVAIAKIPNEIASYLKWRGEENIGK